jgi:ankyrin repeat protein
VETPEKSDTSDDALWKLLRAIVDDDAGAALNLLAASPQLVRARAQNGATRQSAAEHYIVEIDHYLYAGDTALHVAAAGYRVEILRLLLDMGGEVGARNRRGAEPLHYAADGAPGSRSWNPSAQADTVSCLIEAGADPNAADKSGVTPLHRAVRGRCAMAVSALILGGADVKRPNRRGSTPLQLASWATGRGGTGSPESKVQQAQILNQLEAFTASAEMGPAGRSDR